MAESGAGSGFARWLDSVIRARHLKQVDVARMTGVDPVQVMRWRRGEALPSPYYLGKLATAFETDLTELQRLAWSRDSNLPDSSQAIEVERQQWRARYDYVMEKKVPRVMWDAYMAACEALAEAFGKAAPATLRTGDSSPASTSASKSDDPAAGPSGQDLIASWDWKSAAHRSTRLAPA